MADTKSKKLSLSSTKQEMLDMYNQLLKEVEEKKEITNKLQLQIPMDEEKLREAQQEQKKAEKALKKADDEYKTLLNGPSLLKRFQTELPGVPEEISDEPFESNWLTE